MERTIKIAVIVVVAVNLREDDEDGDGNDANASVALESVAAHPKNGGVAVPAAPVRPLVNVVEDVAGLVLFRDAHDGVGSVLLVESVLLGRLDRVVRVSNHSHH